MREKRKAPGPSPANVTSRPDKRRRREIRIALCKQYIESLITKLDKKKRDEISKIRKTMSESPRLPGKILSILNSLHDEIESGKMDESHVRAALRNL
jgi:hypothetical protein